MRLSAALAIALAMSPVAAGAAAIRVPLDHPSIQEALDAAAGGDTVLVAAGEYVLERPLRFPEGTVTLASLEGAGRTTLRMSPTPADPQSASVVMFNYPGEPVLEGFTITGGRGSQNLSTPGGIGDLGGGVFISASASPTIRGCRVWGNSARVYGGGVYCVGNLRLVDCDVRGNSSSRGGGVVCRERKGGVLENCTVSSNVALVGGGVYCGGEASLKLDHCTVAGNSADSGGGARDGGRMTILRSIVWDNTGGSLFRDGGVTEIKQSCVDTDPLFVGWGNAAEVHVDGARTEPGNGTPEAPYRTLTEALRYSYALAPGSPCLGAADDGSNLGASHGQGPAPGVQARRVVLAARRYELEGLSLAHRASIAGGGEEVTFLRGSVAGLRTGASLSGVTVHGGDRGGISVPAGESPLIRDCAIRRNRGDRGGGIYCAPGSSPELVGCLISGNAATSSGGGLYCDAGAQPILRHVTISGNTADLEGAMFIAVNGKVTLESCIVWDNPSGSRASPGLRGSLEARHSSVEATVPLPGPGNIARNPLFCGFPAGRVHVDAAAPAQGDGSAGRPFQDLDGALDLFSYSLQASSPCRGAGEGGSDMGARPGPCEAPGTTGALIVLAPGTYRVPPLLVHGASLQGSGPERTVLWGTVSGLVTGAVLEGCTVTGGVRGGLLLGSNEAPRVSRVVFRANPGGGVVCLGRATPEITDCELRENTSGGLLCDDQAAPVLSRCMIADNRESGLSCAGASTPVLRGCQISGNRALRGGAVLASGLSAPVFENCVLDSNRADSYLGPDGGGVLTLERAAPRFTDCRISRNDPSGISCQGYSRPELIRCILEENRSSNPGGALQCGDHASPRIESTTFVLNWAPAGGAVACEGLSRPLIVSSTITGNSAELSGAILVQGPSFIVLSRSIVWGNAGGALALQEGGQAQVSFSCLDSGEAWPGEGNIARDPLFCGWRRTEVFVDATPRGSPPDGSSESPYPSLPDALRGFRLTLADGSPCLDGAGEGLTMGAHGQGCSEGGGATPVVHLAPGRHETGGVPLAFPAAYRGEGESRSAVSGTVRGLRTGSSLGALTVEAATVEGAPEAGVVVSAGEAPLLERCAVIRSRPGVHCAPGSLPVLEGCVISESSPGVHSREGSRVLLRDCVISRNVTGVLADTQSIASVVRSTLEDNHGYQGAAIQARASAVLSVEACMLLGNQASSGAGVFLEQGARASFRETVFVGNRAEREGGAVHGAEGSSSSWDHCTVAGNMNGEGGVLSGGMALEASSSIFWGNAGGSLTGLSPTAALAMRYSCLEDGALEGPGNLREDPRFCGLAASIHVDPGAAPGGDGTVERPLQTLEGALGAYSFALGPRSPCLAAGEAGTRMGADTGACEEERAGGAIHLTPGIHKASRLFLPVEVRGAGPGSTVLEGNPLWLGEGVRLAGLTLKGGVLVAAGASPEIRDCVITGKQPGFSSGLVAGPRSAPLIEDSVIAGNRGSDGGGVRAEPGAAPILRRVLIRENRASRGGGVYCAEGSAPVLERCVLAGNRSEAEGGGGAVYCGPGSRPRLVRSTVAGNVALNGGGLACEAGASPWIEESILWDNAGGSLHLEEGAAPEIRFSCVEGESAPEGPGNLSADPRFCGWLEPLVHVDAAGPGPGSGSPTDPYRELAPALSGFELTLAADSPCRGAGERGGDLGAVEGECNRAAHARRRVVLRPGAYSLGEAMLAHRVSLAGEDAETTRVEGRLWGLRSAEEVSGLHLHANQDTVLTASRGESPFLLRSRMTGTTGLSSHSASPVVQRCVIDAAATGVRCLGASSTVLEGCELRGNGLQVEALGSSSLRLAGTMLLGGRTGVSVGEEARVEIEDCQAAGFSENAIVARGSSRVSLARSTVRGSVWAGVECREAAEVVLRECIVEENGSISFSSRQSGGVVILNGASAVLERCLLEGNRAREGGGILFRSSGSLLLRDCEVRGNIAGYEGGGVYVGFNSNGTGTARLEGCVLRANRGPPGSGRAGGLVVRQGQVVLDRCTLAGNADGGLLAEGGVLVVRNSILWHNSGPSLAIRPPVRADVSFSCVEGTGPVSGPGNLSVDPLFCAWPVAVAHVDAAAAPGGDGTPERPFRSLTSVSALYRLGLSPGSACRGAGEGGIDMGAPLGTCEGSPSINTVERRLTAILAPGAYPLDTVDLVLGMSLRGAGAERTVVEGHIQGLRTGASLEDITVSCEEGSCITIPPGESPGMARVKVRGSFRAGALVESGAAPSVDSLTIQGVNAFETGLELRGMARGLFTDLVVTGCGTGVYSGDQSEPRFRRALLQGNAKGLSAASSSRPVLEECLLLGNREVAVSAFASSRPWLVNCTLAGNRTALEARQQAAPLFIHSTLAGNLRSIASDSGAGSRFMNSIVWGDSAAGVSGVAFEHSCVEAAEPPPGRGNINRDPLFLDAAAGDYRLRPGSPCIDAGQWTGVAPADQEGNPRPCGREVDMGAFELCTGDLPPTLQFRRGDATAEGRFSVADPIGVLLHLFAAAPLPCEDAADADDSGLVDLSDALALLDVLYRRGAPLPPPYPGCGFDPARDNLSCESYAGCR